MPILNGIITQQERKATEKFHDDNSIYIAEVMDTRSPLNNGDIKVWILTSGNSRDNPKNWVIAHASSNIYGTSIIDNNTSYGTINQQTSFGLWGTIPYVGNYVFIFYPNTTGTSTTPYWFGCPVGLSTNMLPSVTHDLTQNKDLNAKSEVNYKSNINNEPSDYNILNNTLKTQGLNEDRLRGLSTSTSYRDIPSHCYGFVSPLGNQLVIDDGWSTGDKNINWVNDPRPNSNSNNDKDDYGQYYNKKEWVASLEKSDKDNNLNRFHGGFRFRTRNGTQLLILDVGNIYMINKDGTAWVELSEDGYIDCYSAFGISAASDGDINLHAKNVNIEATNNITMSAKRNIILHTPSTVDITSSSVNVSNNISTPHLVASNGSITTLASASANIVGVFSGTLQGTAYYATAAGQQPMNQPLPNINTETVVSPISPTFNEVELQYENTDTSITTRQPTHEPWGGHNKNDSMPDLIVKQVKKEESDTKISVETRSNIVR